MLAWFVAAAFAAALTYIQYAGRLQSLGIAALALRLVALTLAAALLFDAPVGRSTPVTPLVAVDVSQSWTRGGDRAFVQAMDSAARLGRDSLIVFGDSTRVVSTAAARGVSPRDAASRVSEVVERASAAGRPLVLFTDGELDDANALRELPAGSRVAVMPQAPSIDAAVRDVQAPRAIVAGDTIDVQATVVAGASTTPGGRAELLAGSRVIATTVLPSLGAWGETRIAFHLAASIPTGSNVLRVVAQVPNDAEHANDTLSLGVDVSEAPGAVFVSTSPDFDARYALSVLRGAVSLPTRGFYRVSPDEWRVEGTFAPIAESSVKAALRDAPVAIIHGDTSAFGAVASATRGPVGLIVPAAGDDDWYASDAPSSPLAAALAGIMWDSLPPLIVPDVAPKGEWTVLDAKRARAGDARPIIVGSEVNGRRRVVVAASGLWRWSFRGGSSADAFTALWGNIFDWLAESRADKRSARPDDRVVRAGEPIVWRRGSMAASDSVANVVLRRSDRASAKSDTLRLRFADGAATTTSPALAPGVYAATMNGGNALVAVNASRELLPRQPTAKSGSIGRAAAPDDAPRLRERGWVYLLVVLLLCGEWLLRRRIGLR